MNRRADGLAREDRGSAAVEFAMILPMLLLLGFSFYEAGRMYWGYTTVKVATRDAARYAARLPVTCTGSAGALDDATDEARIQNLARTSTIDGSGDPVLAGWTDNNTVAVVIDCIDNTSGALGGRYQGFATIPTVTVTAAAPYGMMFGGLFGDLDLPTITVRNAQVWTL